jgi:hypothetical protein
MAHSCNLFNLIHINVFKLLFYLLKYYRHHSLLSIFYCLLQTILLSIVSLSSLMQELVAAPLLSCLSTIFYVFEFHLKTKAWYLKEAFHFLVVLNSSLVIWATIWSWSFYRLWGRRRCHTFPCQFLISLLLFPIDKVMPLHIVLILLTEKL